MRISLTAAFTPARALHPPSIMLTVMLLLIFNIFTANVSRADDNYTHYKFLINETIRFIDQNPDEDIRYLMALQDRLIALGIEACLKYAESHPETAKGLYFMARNTQSMKSLTLPLIEKLWHSGVILKSQGIELQNDGHFNELSSLIDTVIHPATAYIALKQYQRVQETTYLDRVKTELTDVLPHITELQKMTQTLDQQTIHKQTQEIN